MLEGRVLGPCGESTEPALAFSVGNSGFRHERVLFRRHGALPSQSPFLWYKLDVHLGAAAPIWTVVRVISVEKLPVLKTELVERVASLVQEDSHEVAAALIADLEGAPDVLRPADIPSKHAVARELASDAWQSDAFYELLPYFPAAFLRGLDERELAFVGQLFAEDPLLFAHWRAASRKLAVGVAATKLYADQELLCSREFCSYNARCPALHFAHVDAISKLHGRAFSFSLQMLRDFCYRGHLSHPCGQTLYASQLAPYYMRIEGCIVDSADARDQAHLVLALKELAEVRMVQCAYLDDDAVSHLLNLGPSWRICSSRPSLTEYIECVTGGNARSGSKKLCVVNAHKLGPRLLIELIESLPELEHLVLAGDVCEEPAHYAAGGGDVFRDLYENHPLRLREDWSDHLGSYASRVAHSISNASSAQFQLRRADDDEELKKFAVAWKESRKDSWVVICTEDFRRRRLRKWLGFDRVRLGHRVHLLESDEVGVLVRAVSLSTKKKVSKKAWLHENDDYELHVAVGGRTIKVKRSEATVEMNDVAISRFWVGPRVKDLLFVAETNTSLEEIMGVLKYVEGDFVLATVGVDRLMDLPLLRRRRRSLLPDLLK